MKTNTIKSLCLSLVALAASVAVPAVVKAAGTEFDENPMPVKTPPPEYPADLKDQHVDGMVILKVSLSTDGSVEDCEVKKSTNAGFDVPAVNAVKSWKFKPAVKAGTPVKAKILLPVKFSHEG